MPKDVFPDSILKGARRKLPKWIMEGRTVKRAQEAPAREHPRKHPRRSFLKKVSRDFSHGAIHERLSQRIIPKEFPIQHSKRSGPGARYMWMSENAPPSEAPGNVTQGATQDPSTPREHTRQFPRKHAQVSVLESSYRILICTREGVPQNTVN